MSGPCHDATLYSLRTVSDPAAARKIEELLETEFLAQASLFPETQSVWVALAAAGRTEQWAFMQHHGCPTRLLDWTASAYVAAYFAVDQLLNCDGALYVVGAAALDQHWASIDRGPVSIGSDELVDPSTPERVVFTWPQFRSQRLAIQQGHFSVSTKLLSAHDGPILDACASAAFGKSERVIHRKIVIASDLKLVILQQLRAMNIAPHALFPSLDGFGRSLADLARLKATLA